MTERIIEVGVPAGAYLEIEARKNAGDGLTNDMIARDIENLLETLFESGLITDGDDIDVTFYPDENLPSDSRGRLIKVTKVLRDEQDENIIGKYTTSVVIEARYQINN